MRWMALSGIMASAIGLAQRPVAAVATEFEVVSVKRQMQTPIDPFQPERVVASLPGRTGGPGTRTPDRVRYSQFTLLGLIKEAYDLHPDQVVGPSWLREDHFTVEALLPPGTTKVAFRQMLGNMLASRFKLAFHWEERSFRAYSLVQAPGGVKMRRSAVTEVPEDDDPLAYARMLSTKVDVDKNGCPILPSTRRDVRGKDTCLSFVGYAMADLSNWLEKMVANETGGNYGPNAWPAHIMDATGLSGRFDFMLDYDSFYHVMAHTPNVPPNLVRSRNPTSIFKAVEAQLGLKLELNTATLKVMVIRQAERVPTEN